VAERGEKSAVHGWFTNLERNELFLKSARKNELGSRGSQKPEVAFRRTGSRSEEKRVVYGRGAESVEGEIHPKRQIPLQGIARHTEGVMSKHS